MSRPAGHMPGGHQPEGHLPGEQSGTGLIALREMFFEGREAVMFFEGAERLMFYENEDAD